MRIPILFAPRSDNMSLRITSWNINSIRIRLPLIQKLIEQVNPDILCLQETKVENQHFPGAAVQALGYDYLYFNGQKSYHGVAILSKIPLKNARCDRFIDNDDKRHITASLPDGTQIHNFYVPAGGDIPDVNQNPKFKEKLDFMDAMTNWSATTVKPTDKIIILGDFNIAPLEHDVWSHKQLLNVVSHTPIEVEKLNALKDSIGWVDVMREQIPHDQKLYSWWSYRAADWQASNRGRRLDHVWVTPALKPHIERGEILSQARGWDSPSDHVPVTITFKGINLP